MRRVILAIAVIGGAVFGVSQALGASEAITAIGPDPHYGKVSFTIDRGATATFDNQDSSATQHDVTAFDTGGAKNLPLFRSATISAGQTPVNGTASLGAGTYRFFCTVHPTQMTGQLVVTPSSTPTVAVTILSRRIGPVASSGKLKVKVRGVLATNTVPLTARKGKKKLGSTRVDDLAAGSSRTVKLALSRAGRNALKNGGSAKIKVTAAPPGDQQVSAAQRLR